MDFLLGTCSNVQRRISIGHPRTVIFEITHAFCHRETLKRRHHNSAVNTRNERVIPDILATIKRQCISVATPKRNTRVQPMITVYVCEKSTSLVSKANCVHIFRNYEICSISVDKTLRRCEYAKKRKRKKKARTGLFMLMCFSLSSSACPYKGRRKKLI